MTATSDSQTNPQTGPEAHRREFVRASSAVIETAPDGMTVDVLARGSRASMARFRLEADAVGRAVRHRTVDELWYVTAGGGELWTHQPHNNQSAAEERVRVLGPGDSLLIEAGTCFQVRTQSDGLDVVATTVPPWPGEEEALLVAGKWTPTLSAGGNSSFSVTTALPDEANALAALALRAKAWWRYDDAFLAACKAELRVADAQIQAGQVLVARDPSGILGFAGFHFGSDGCCELSHCFVEPVHMSRGVGNALMAAVRTTLTAGGVASLLIQADPGAAPFYERVGAVLKGTMPSLSIPGRDLPLLELIIEPESLSEARK